MKVQSAPLTKEQAKNMQIEAQKNGVMPETDWNSYNTKELALNLGKQAAISGVVAATVATGFNMAARAFKGEQIEANEVVATALKTGADAGVKCAAAGALKVGSEKGILTIIPKGTPMGIISNLACVAIENVKILGKVATGEYTVSEGLDHVGRTTTAMWMGLTWGAKATLVGAAIGTLIPIPIVGTVVGGLVGGMVGYMAGSKVGQTIYDGFKKVCNTAKTFVKSMWSGLKSVGRKIKNFISW